MSVDYQHAIAHVESVIPAAATKSDDATQFNILYRNTDPTQNIWHYVGAVAPNQTNDVPLDFFVPFVPAVEIGVQSLNANTETGEIISCGTVALTQR